MAYRDLKREEDREEVITASSYMRCFIINLFTDLLDYETANILDYMYVMYGIGLYDCCCNLMVWDCFKTA